MGGVNLGVTSFPFTFDRRFSSFNLIRLREFLGSMQMKKKMLYNNNNNNRIIHTYTYIHKQTFINIMTS